MTKDNQNEKAAILNLSQMIFGGFLQQSISVVAKLGISDLLQSGPTGIEELADVTHTHGPSLYRLLRALSGVGIYKELDGKRFELDVLGNFLQTDVEGSLRGFAIMIGEAWHRGSWNQLMHTVKTGETAFQKVYGAKVFEYFTNNKEAGEIFNNAMSGLSKDIGGVLAAYDFSAFERVIDIGGGHGSLIAELLKQNPRVQGGVFDLSVVIEGTRKLIKEAGLENRCQCLPGSFFDFIPSGADAYIMKNIIHDWNDEEAVQILRNCQPAIGDHGKLLLIETVIKEKEKSPIPLFMDLEMMVMATGKERTELEFKELFAKAGFTLTRIIPAPSHLSIIEGISAN